MKGRPRIDIFFIVENAFPDPQLVQLFLSFEKNACKSVQLLIHQVASFYLNISLGRNNF